MEYCCNFLCSQSKLWDFVSDCWWSLKRKTVVYLPLLNNKPPASSSFHLAGRLQAILEIAILSLFLPITMAFTLWNISSHYLLQRHRSHDKKTFKELHHTPFKKDESQGDQWTILVTGAKMAKALIVSRCLWRAGHRVVLVESSKYWCSGSRFSRSVWKFETVSDKNYISDIVDLIKKYKVDIFLPVASPKSVFMDAKIKRIVESDPDLSNCQCPFFSSELLGIVEDKHTFGSHCLSHGLPAPQTWKVTCKTDVIKLNRKLLENHSKRRFILKNIGYDPVHRLDMFCLPQKEEKVVEHYLDRVERDGNPITEGAPWQVQEFITGEEFSACCVVRKGRLRLLTVCHSSPSQIDYVECQDERVVNAIQDFTRKMILQLFPANTDTAFCLDFIIDLSSAGSETVVPYVIECNPRIHSQIVVYRQNSQTMSALGESLVTAGSAESASDIQRLGARSMVPYGEALFSYYWLYNEIFKLLFPKTYGRSSWGQLARAIMKGSEADFDPEDPMPFIMRNHFQIPALLLGVAYRGAPWKKFDINIGKVVEVGGD